MNKFFEESGFAEVLKKETEKRKKPQVAEEPQTPKEMTFEQAFRRLGRVLSGN